ncbi:MAG TPA: HIT domain-containing protein [Acidimicrobiales bacterium]|nr:HIT domain-containing protein [Acidimicrobiales bacterium]
MSDHGLRATQAGALARLWAGWRMPYLVEGSDGGDEADGEACVFCRILASDDPPEETYVLWRDERCAAVLNAYPYTSGHLLVLPVRHLGDLEELTAEEATGTWATVTTAVRALKDAYSPEGVNVGINLGRAAGAGVPGHFHVHCLPRWDGDTNFMTTVAEARVIPESLPSTFERLRAAWPSRS